MFERLRGPGLALAAFAALAPAALANAAGPVGDEADPVQVFNKVCYSQVPSIDAITSMAADLDWKPLEKAELKAFASDINPDFLEGWDLQVGKRFYRLGLVRTDASENMGKSFPEFASGKATTCTLVLDGAADAAKVSEGMQKLAGKEPTSRDVPEGEFLTTTWAGGNNDFKVFLISKAAAAGESGLLNVTILAK